MTTTSPELLTYAQAAQRVNLGVLDVRAWSAPSSARSCWTPAAAAVYPAVGLTIPPGG